MKEQFIKMAIRIGNTLCRDAIRYAGQCNWIGVDNDADIRPRPYYAALKSTWYSGTSGIAWFLAHVYALSNEQRHRVIALEAIEQALQHAGKITYGKMGFHSGQTGIAFAAIEIGQMLDEQELVDRGLRLLKELNSIPQSEYTLDVIDGCAGAIPAIIRLQKKLDDPEVDILLNKMGEFLLQQAQPESTGISWNTMTEGTVANLTGYAHGAAGIASALLELFYYTNDVRYETAAMNGFAYEDSCFDATQQNWPDFREFSSTKKTEDSPRSCGCAWCHGAPGIGLSRLRAYVLTGKEEFKESAEVALDTMMRNFQQKQLGNYSLCHGLFGNADLALYAAEIHNDDALKEKVEVMAINAIEKYASRNIPFPNGSQSEYSAPDMMLGQAGIGYGFLRVADPQKYQSVLIIH